MNWFTTLSPLQFKQACYQWYVTIDPAAAVFPPFYAATGFFKSLQHELILTNIAVDVTIMPLPFVETELVSKELKFLNIQ